MFRGSLGLPSLGEHTPSDRGSDNEAPPNGVSSTGIAMSRRACDSGLDHSSLGIEREYQPIETGYGILGRGGCGLAGLIDDSLDLQDYVTCQHWSFCAVYWENRQRMVGPRISLLS